MTTTLLDTIETLASTRPLDQRAVEQALDVALRPDTDNENRYIYVLRSFRTPPGVVGVELRVPLRGATRKDGLLIVDLDPDAQTVTPEDVRERFGDATELSEPTPEQPAEAARYFCYARPWGELRFGFARPRVDRLTTFVVDAER